METILVTAPILPPANLLLALLNSTKTSIQINIALWLATGTHEYLLTIGPLPWTMTDGGPFRHHLEVRSRFSILMRIRRAPTMFPSAGTGKPRLTIQKSGPWLRCTSQIFFASLAADSTWLQQLLCHFINPFVTLK